MLIGVNICKYDRMQVLFFNCTNPSAQVVRVHVSLLDVCASNAKHSVTFVMTLICTEQNWTQAIYAAPMTLNGHGLCIFYDWFGYLFLSFFFRGSFIFLIISFHLISSTHWIACQLQFRSNGPKSKKSNTACTMKF